MALKTDLQRLNILTAGAATSVKTRRQATCKSAGVHSRGKWHALNDPKESSWLTGNCRQTGHSPPLTK